MSEQPAGRLLPHVAFQLGDQGRAGLHRVQAALGRQLCQQIGHEARSAADFEHVVRRLNARAAQNRGLHAPNGQGLLLQPLRLKMRVVERFELVRARIHVGHVSTRGRSTGSSIPGCERERTS